MSTPSLILLGPQQPTPTVPQFMDELPAGDCAVITAGWQEREAEDDELQSVLGRRCHDLRLYARARELWKEDRAQQDAHRRLQDRLMQLRRAYGVRLQRAMQAWADLAREELDPDIAAPERAAALETVRRIDAEHLARVDELRAEAREAWPDSAALARHRDEIARVVDGCAVVVIPGGHVAVLLNRMRMFGVGDWLAEKAVVAWSAGAMALAARVVLFHDSPPQGSRHAEAFDHGLGLFDDVVLLPHGGTRLDLHDAERVGRFAERFAPARCCVLDHGTGLRRTAEGWQPTAGTHMLAADGSVPEMSAC